MLQTVLFTRVSGNKKTGPIPVSMSPKYTCPDTCPLKENGCYASGGPINIHWNRLSNGKVGILWGAFIKAIRALPRGQLWRHNQAGDLPGQNNAIDVVQLAELVEANTGRNGFTYTHKPVLKGQSDNATLAANKQAIQQANAKGFTVNLSADTLSEADEMHALGIGPVVVLLPITQSANTVTPKGVKVVVCPATQREDVSCSTCKLCQRVARTCIVGFPAHGFATRKANAIAIS